VALWLDNDEGSHLWLYSLANEPVGGDEPAAHLIDLADRLQQEVEDAAQAFLERGSKQACVFWDLLNHAVGRVDWREIIEANREEEAEAREEEQAEHERLEPIRREIETLDMEGVDQ